MSLLSAKFQIPTPTRSEKRGAPQEVAISTPAQTAKTPRAANISIEHGPRPAQMYRRPPASAPVDVCIYKYTEDASDLWDLFHGKKVPLFQVQIFHNAQRSITFQMRDSFNDFLASAKKEDDTMPASVQELETMAGVKLVVGDRIDPDNVGFQSWRVAFYCTDAINFLHLLDGWFQYRKTEIDREQPFQVVLRPHVDIDLSGVECDLLYVRALAAPLFVFSIDRFRWHMRSISIV